MFGHTSLCVCGDTHVDGDVVSSNSGEEMRQEHGSTWDIRIHMVGMA